MALRSETELWGGVPVGLLKKRVTLEELQELFPEDEKWEAVRLLDGRGNLQDYTRPFLIYGRLAKRDPGKQFLAYRINPKGKLFVGSPDVITPPLVKFGRENGYLTANFQRFASSNERDFFLEDYCERCDSEGSCRSTEKIRNGEAYDSYWDEMLVRLQKNKDSSMSDDKKFPESVVVCKKYDFPKRQT